jgi:hypothetical protein
MLLLVTLVSRSATADVAKIAYEIFHNESRVTCVVKHKTATDEAQKKQDINDAMVLMEDGTRHISRLLKERRSLYADIQERFASASRARASFDEGQIERFAAFTALSESQNTTIREYLTRINSQKDLNAVKKELLHNNADYDLILNELDVFNDFQNETSSLLENVIAEGRAFMELL